MQAREFVKRVEAVPPNYEELKDFFEKKGYGEDGVSSSLKRYYFTRKNEGSYEERDDPIIELVSNFDLFGFSVGYIGFEDEPTLESGKVIVGFFEADPLSIDSETGQIEVFSHEDEEQHLFDCAASSSQFLDALLVAIELFKKRTLNEVEPKDHELNRRYIEQCTLLAGGEEYEDFFIELLDIKEFN